MAAAAEPPPLPELPIEILNEHNYRTVQRYGVVFHPYIRRVKYGPYVITHFEDSRGRGGVTRYYHLILEDYLFDEHNNPVPIRDLLKNRRMHTAQYLIAWTPDTEHGQVDPLYPIIEAPEGKFRPGVRVTGHFLVPDHLMKVIEGPFRGRNDEGHPTIFYICRPEDPRYRAHILVKEENQLREHTPNLEARMKYSSRLHRQANRILNVKNIIAGKLSTVEGQHVVEAASGAASVGQASVSPFLGARGTAKGTVKTTKQYPENIMKRIANFAYGNTKHINEIRRKAELYGGPIAHELPPLQKRRSSQKRRSTLKGGGKKRRTQRHRRLSAT